MLWYKYITCFVLYGLISLNIEQVVWLILIIVLILSLHIHIYQILLKSENYVTRRRSLKLLGEILLDRWWDEIGIWQKLHKCICMHTYIHISIRRIMLQHDLVDNRIYIYCSYSVCYLIHRLHACNRQNLSTYSISLCVRTNAPTSLTITRCSNFNVMMRFISSEYNLQMVMNLLRDNSGSIQFE